MIRTLDVLEARASGCVLPTQPRKWFRHTRSACHFVPFSLGFGALSIGKRVFSGWPFLCQLQRLVGAASGNAFVCFEAFSSVRLSGTMRRSLTRQFASPVVRTSAKRSNATENSSQDHESDQPILAGFQTLFLGPTQRLIFHQSAYKLASVSEKFVSKNQTVAAAGTPHRQA